eukprot:gene31118-38455_t
MRYCPAPNCEKVAMASGQTNICCECTFCYCFDCGEETHDPASCSQLGKWIEKCASDGESAKWIFANTKKCPKCFTRIEKNQGCNHMTCRSATCTHQFCWICMGNWAGHTNCNRFNAEENAIQRAKAELDRYLHYYNRYQAHDLALRIANKQRATAELRMKERQDRKSDAWIDVQFIHEAVEQVIACRRVLKYTYVIGFYMPENSPEKLLFERHQVVNWTRITEKFRNAILDNFMDGQMIGGGENSMQSSNVFDFASNNNTSSNGSSSAAATGGETVFYFDDGTEFSLKPELGMCLIFNQNILHEGATLSALELYDQAVQLDNEKRNDEAIVFYKRAMKVYDDIEMLYYSMYGYSY